MQCHATQALNPRLTLFVSGACLYQPEPPIYILDNLHPQGVSRKTYLILDFKKIMIDFDNLNGLNLFYQAIYDIFKQFSFVSFYQHVCFKVPCTNQIQIYAKLKQLFEHLLQKWRRWPLLGTVVHPSALLLPGNVSDLSDLRQFYFSVILSEFGARPR